MSTPSRCPEPDPYRPRRAGASGGGGAAGRSSTANKRRSAGKVTTDSGSTETTGSLARPRTRKSTACSVPPLAPATTPPISGSRAGAVLIP